MNSSRSRRSKTPLSFDLTLEGVPTLQRGPKRGDECLVKINKLDSKGLGVALVDALVGPQKELKSYAIRVPHTLPDEVVRVAVDKTRKGEVATSRLELVHTSEDRIVSQCPHFGLQNLEQNQGCGGCTIQSVSYATQLELKQQVVSQAFEDYPEVTPLIQPVMACESPLYYRNKMEFSFGDHLHTTFAVGLHPAGRRYDVLELQSCHLLSPWVEALLPALSSWCVEHDVKPFSHAKNGGFLRQLMMREGKNTGERLVELMTSAVPTAVFDGEEREAQFVAHQVCEQILAISKDAGFDIRTVYWTQHYAKKGERSRQIEEVVHGDGVFHETLQIGTQKTLDFAIHPRAFFQPNTRQAQHLYEEVLLAANLLKRNAHGELVASEESDKKPQLALDLYCGTGTIALCLAPFVDRVVGVELNAQAVENANKNAVHNALGNVRFFAGDVAEVLEQDDFISEVGEQGVDLVVVDPPRAGLMPQAIAHINAINAPVLVYVSCNPRSLARDLGRLQESSDYELISVQPVDMFPQTMHVENVALFKRRES